MTTDLQRRGLLSSITGRLPSASYEELRLLDLVLERLEFARTGPDRSWNFAADLCDSLIRGLHGALAERDRQTAELKEAARDEMVGGPNEDASGIGVRVRMMANFVTDRDLQRALGLEVELAGTSADRRQRCVDEHGYGCARPECGRGRRVTGAAAMEAAAELAEWQADAHLTRASDVPARIARADIDDDEPYADWDLTDLGGEGG